MSKVVRKVVTSCLAPPAVGPYSHASGTSQLLFISGQLGLVPHTMELAGDDVVSQLHQALQNIRSVLEVAGLTMRNVVKTTVLLTDMDDFGKVNPVYEKYFNEPYPARTTYQVVGLPKKGKVEIEAIAMYGDVTFE